jgi:hypothetical protein
MWLNCECLTTTQETTYLISITEKPNSTIIEIQKYSSSFENLAFLVFKSKFSFGKHSGKNCMNWQTSVNMIFSLNVIFFWKSLMKGPALFGWSGWRNGLISEITFSFVSKLKTRMWFQFSCTQCDGVRDVCSHTRTYLFIPTSWSVVKEYVRPCHLSTTEKSDAISKM